MSYKPLPDTVTIKRSKVDGLGLFASKPIPKGTILGVTHIKNRSFEHGLIRTPLGGFINHSEYPNCQLIKFPNGFVLETLYEIIIGEELTLKYQLYNIEEE